jgi:hypothetical protein
VRTRTEIALKQRIAPRILPLLQHGHETRPAQLPEVAG